jgi:hypothetical protein
MTPKSELAWTFADYQREGREAPGRCESNPGKTEGEMMREEELEQYMSDSVQTVMILRDKNSERAAEVWGIFIADLDYLLSIGRIDDDQYNELTNEQNYSF